MNIKIISKTEAGFLIAPLVPTLLIPFIFKFHPTILAISIAVSYLCALIIGLPLFYILKKYNKINYITILCIGLFSAIFPFLTIMVINNGFSAELLKSYNIEGLLFVGFCGVLASSVFWYIAVKNESNK